MRIVLHLISFPFILALSLLTIRAFWDWFILPLGAPSIGYVHAGALAFVSGYLTHQVDWHDNPDKDVWIAKLVFAWVKPIFCLCIGWVFHYFM